MECMEIEQSDLDSTTSSILCREHEISILRDLMSPLSVSSVFVCGQTGTGKSLVVETLLQELEINYSVVNCVECYAPRLLFEHILNNISGTVPCIENGFQPFARCDNMNDFILHLKKATNGSEKPICIVLDKAERMRDMAANMLPGFLRLSEISGLNVCTVFLSEIVWQKFRAGTGIREPYIVNFSNYGKDELIEIMSKDCPAEYEVTFYRNYLNLLLSVCCHLCCNLNELRHLAVLNFPKYVEPILNEEAMTSNTTKLWRNFEPHLKKALQTIYLREVSSAQWEKLQKEVIDQGNNDAIQNLTGNAARANIELPFYSKYLLIAAYLASYNPAKSDKRFFATRTTKMTKRSNLHQRKKDERTANHLLGPKPFPLDRLMAIFYSIVEGKVAPTANIFSQISTLVTLGLMVQLSSADPLDTPKYKCLVTLDFAKFISRTVNFDVLRHLFDFI